MVRLLLENGANIKAENNQNALAEAAGRGYEAIVRLLLEKGADVNVEDFKNRTPLVLGNISGHKAIEKLLREKGAK
ncbi:hypothetical protein G7Y89_g2503 [Cudoniella acicularis]|uniref:Ankyrin repeat protein n=1 Tax=Cudoniella acicularis TaxID=354080 RepID=A0A8H4RTC8_9HELO|nr:hypothetical protein G7Y89_g2503 [Cudoniella acicularis]